MLYYIVKPAGGLMGRTRKVSRGAVIVEGPRDTLEEARAMLDAPAHRNLTRAIASREHARDRLKWVEGATWMLTALQAAKVNKK